MKRKIKISILFFLVFAQYLFSQNTETPLNGNVVSIAYYNKTLYYQGNASDNPVYVRITIANNGAQALRFKLADDRMFSIDFTVHTVKNAQLPYTETAIRRRSTNQKVYFREVTIESGEEYSFTENLKEYIDIQDPGLYYVEVSFFPELYRSQSGSRTAYAQAEYPEGTVVSNRLTLEIKPAPGAAAVAALPLSTSNQQILRPQVIAPDKVIEQTIVARQKNLWDQYFLYMDVEQMLLRDPVRSRKYRSESAAERARMIENYKLDLQQARIDKDIVALPVQFKIEKTMYTATEGTVTVMQWFQYDRYREKKRYTYYLRQRDDIWQIYDYTVDNLGTE